MWNRHASGRVLRKSFMVDVYRLPFAAVLFAAICATFAGSLDAATVYKYKDANGRWVITDKPPQGTAAVSVEQQRLVYTEKNPSISIVNRGTKQRPVLYAVNQTGGPAQIWVDFTR